MKILASPYREQFESNPVLRLLYGALETMESDISAFSGRKLLYGSWDIWHLHWPEEYTISWVSPRVAARRLLKFWVMLKIARFKKTKVFWTVHNLHPHELNPPLRTLLFWRLFLPNLDGIICMSRSGTELLHRERPRTQSIPTFVIPHGHYRHVYPDTVSRDSARKRFGIAAE